MGSRGDAYDNALAESFFATLKTELVDRDCFSPAALRAWQRSISSRPGATPAQAFQSRSNFTGGV